METPEGEIGGYAWYRWNDDAAPADAQTPARAEKSVFGICVRTDHQGRGAGRALLTRLSEIAKTVGPSVMSLTVQKANERAFGLYRKFGFEVVREQMLARDPDGGFDSEPEYYMERRVQAGAASSAKATQT